MEIIKYDTEDEAEQIIADKTSAGYTLVEVQNVTEGNFLGFQPPDWIAPETEETQLQKAQKQLAELESRTKVLEYSAQTTGETLDVHEGAIYDVLKLALGGSPEDL